MGLVTVLSGLAVPVGILIGAGPLDGAGRVVEIFDNVMWVVNPFGMWLIQFMGGLMSAIGLYILGTMVSAYCWGMIDALVFFGRSKGK